MMAEVKWIKITTDVFDDDKILLIESLPSADSIIVIWFKLLILAGKHNNDGVFIMGDRIPYTDEMLAAIFRRDVNTVRLALSTFEKFGMIEMIDNVITIPNWGKHQSLDAYEKKKQRDRERIAKKRAEQRLLASMSSDCRATDSDASPSVAVSEEEKDREGDKKEKKSVRETTLTLFQRLAPDYILDMPEHAKLYAKVEEWVKYKMERKEAYKEQGMKALLRQIENNALTYGDRAVCDLIEESMSNGWKGIIFDRLKQQKRATRDRNKRFDTGFQTSNPFLEMLQEEM